jgi:hypothetical protein
MSERLFELMALALAVLDLHRANAVFELLPVAFLALVRATEE